MTTGVMPPGSIKGGAFIHDPKVKITVCSGKYLQNGMGNRV